MHVLHVYPKSDFFTGAAIQLFELAKGLQRRGHDVAIVTQPSREWADRSGRVGIPHYGLPMRSAIDLTSARALSAIVRRHRVDVVHAHKGKARSLALLAGLLASFPVLVLNRGVSFPVARLQRLGYTTRRVSGIIAVCEAIKRGLVSSGVPANKIEVIYSGTDTTRFHPDVDGRPVRETLGFSPSEFVFTQIGVRSWKGNDDAIDAMVWLSTTAPLARLLIVGARNPATLLERARLKRLTGAVRVIGYRDDIPEILAASDCCIDASYAGLGITGTLRESLAVGTPVIATDLEGNPELVIHGTTGLLVPPRRPEALAHAMTEMVNDPPTARRMAVLGHERVLDLFSMERKIERTEAFYERLLRRPAVSRA